MSPLLLLLVEVTLVLATAYLFWLNRRQTVALRAAANPPATDRPFPDRAAPVEMMHDLADVLTEVRAAVQDMRTEWQRERDALQHQLAQAEKTIAEMRAQMRTLTPHVTAIGAGAESTSAPARLCPPAPTPGVASARLEDAMHRFTDDLVQSGLSEHSVRRIVASVREFATWFGGQCYGGLSLDAIEYAHVERFVHQLQRRHLRHSTITRKAAAVKRFLAWRSSQCPTRITEPGVCVARPSVTAAAPTVVVAPMNGADRRAAALDLAEQGLDTSLIAARLGLERDTVRMLLSSANGRRPANNGFSDRLTFNLGASFSGRTPQVVHGPLS